MALHARHCRRSDADARFVVARLNHSCHCEANLCETVPSGLQGRNALDELIRHLARLFLRLHVTAPWVPGDDMAHDGYCPDLGSALVRSGTVGGRAECGMRRNSGGRRNGNLGGVCREGEVIQAHHRATLGNRLEVGNAGISKRLESFVPLPSLQKSRTLRRVVVVDN